MQATRNCLTRLHKAAWTTGAVLALIGPSAALGETYRIATLTQGDGSFAAGGIFGHDDEYVQGPYSARTFLEFSDPTLVAFPSEGTYFASNATLRFEFQIGGRSYLRETNLATLRLTYSGSNGMVETLSYSTDFPPEPPGNVAYFVQTLALAPGALSFGDVLAHGTTLSTADVQGNGSMGLYYYVRHDDVSILLGSSEGSVTAVDFSVSLVPEPSAWAMTLLGCAVIAGVALRGGPARHGAPRA